MLRNFRFLRKGSGELPSEILVERYIAGECTPGEAVAVDRWIEQNPGAGAALRTMRDDAAHEAMAAQDGTAEARQWVDQRFRNAATSLGRSAQIPLTFQADRSRRGIGSGFMPRTRVVVGGIGLFGALVLSMVSRNAGRTDSRLTRREYASRSGERATVRLPDGSDVVLAPETQLRYVTDQSGARIVELTGEAFFTVAQAQQAPFVVHAGPATTRVLGTSFDVRFYSGDSAAVIAVTSGKVQSQNGLRKAVLAPGMAGIVSDSVVAVTASDKVNETISWTKGELVFSNTPVPVMLANLGRWCGYRFKLADSTLANDVVTTALRVDEPRETMQLLKELLGVRMTFDGNVVTLHTLQSIEKTEVKARKSKLEGPSKTREVGR